MNDEEAEIDWCRLCPIYEDCIERRQRCLVFQHENMMEAACSPSRSSKVETNGDYFSTTSCIGEAGGYSSSAGELQGTGAMGWLPS